MDHFLFAALIVVSITYTASSVLIRADRWLDRRLSRTDRRHQARRVR